MDRFEDLMNRYVQRSLSQEERMEFFQLLAERNDVRLPDELINEIKKDEDADRFLRESYDDNYGKILSALNLKPEEDPVSFDSSSQDQPDTVPLHRSRYWYARAAAIIVIAMAAGVLVLSKSGKLFDPFSTEQEARLSRFQGKQLVDLPDGSKVVLNENSELNFNGDTFGMEAREVNLIGEATFDVAHDSSKPFVVHTGKVSTKVLGTEFNVRAFANHAQVTVTVLRGLVEVRGEERIYGQIRPNEQIAVNTTTNDFVQRKTNAEEAVQWKSTFLIFDNLTLDEAARLISKKFNVQIRFENEALKKCRFFGTFLNDESLNDVLTVISTTMRIEFKIEKNTNRVTLSGKGCN